MMTHDSFVEILTQLIHHNSSAEEEMAEEVSKYIENNKNTIKQSCKDKDFFHCLIALSKRIQKEIIDEKWSTVSDKLINIATECSDSPLKQESSISDEKP